MGALYVAMPLDDKLREWLRGENVDVEDGGASRWPTPRELRAVLDDYHPEYTPKPDGAWDAAVFAEPARRWEGEHATLWVKPSLSDDEPVEFSFHRPSVEMAIRLLERLAHTCGPYVLVESSAVAPVVVRAGCDPAETAARWIATWG